MQAVRSAENEALSSEGQAEWLRVVDELGAKRQLLVVSTTVEHNLEQQGVYDFLYSMWQTEEVERRRREGWLIPVIVTLFFCFTLSLLALAVWTLIAAMRNGPRPEITPTSLVSLYVCLIFPIAYLSQKRQRQRALAFLLTNSRTVPPLSVLVDALDFPEFEQETRLRLTKLLPAYRDSDAPLLDERQRRALLTALKSGLNRRMELGRNYFTDTDVAFMTALIRHFEREVACNEPIPKGMVPLLQRFVRSKPHREESGRWKPVRAAAENYLLHVGQPLSVEK